MCTSGREKTDCFADAVQWAVEKKTAGGTSATTYPMDT